MFNYFVIISILYRFRESRKVMPIKLIQLTILNCPISEDRNVVADLTHHATCLHRDTELWIRHTDLNQKMTQSVHDVVSAVKRIVQVFILNKCLLIELGTVKRIVQVFILNKCLLIELGTVKRIVQVFRLNKCLLIELGVVRNRDIIYTPCTRSLKLYTLCINIIVTGARWKL